MTKLNFVLHKDFPKLAKAIKDNDTDAATRILRDFSLLNPSWVELIVANKFKDAESYYYALGHVKSAQMMRILLSAGLPVLDLILAMTRNRISLDTRMGILFLLLSPNACGPVQNDSTVCAISLEPMRIPIKFGNIEYDLINLMKGLQENINIGYENVSIWDSIEKFELNIDLIRRNIKELEKNNKNEIIRFELEKLNQTISNFQETRSTMVQELQKVTSKQLSDDPNKSLGDIYIDVVDSTVANVAELYGQMQRTLLFSICLALVQSTITNALLEDSTETINMSRLLNQFAAGSSREILHVLNILSIPILITVFYVWLEMDKPVEKFDKYMKDMSNNGNVEPYKIPSYIKFIFTMSNRVKCERGAQQSLLQFEKDITGIRNLGLRLYKFEEDYTSAILIKNLHGCDFSKERLELWSAIRGRFKSDWHNTDTQPKSLTFWKQALESTEPLIVDEDAKFDNSPALKLTS